MPQIGTAYVDVVGNFAPLMKQAQSSTLKSKLATIGKVGAVATAAIGAAAIKSSIEFGSAMRQISTQAGAGAGEVKRLHDQVLNLSTKRTQAPVELAQALYHIESVGYRGHKAMQILAKSSKLAMLGQADLEDTTNAVVAAMTTGIQGANNMGKAVGLLNAIVGQGNMRMNDLAGAMSTGVLPAAKNFGLSLREVGAALDVMTARGMPAQQSATRLRMTFSLLAAPSKEAADALGQIGINSEQLGNVMSKRGLIPAIRLLADNLHKAGSEADQARILTEAFGGGRSSAAIMTLVQNVDDLQGKYNTLGKQTEDFGKKWKQIQDKPGVKLQESLNRIRVVLIQLGDVIAPAFANALYDVTKVLTGPGSIGEKIGKLGDMISNAITSAGPGIAKAAIELGANLSVNLVKGFVQADALGKLFLGAAALKLFGPPGVFSSLGKRMGTTVAGGFAPAMSTAIKKTGTADMFGINAAKARAVGTQAGTATGSSFVASTKETMTKASTGLKGYMSGVGNRLGGAMMIGMGSQIVSATMPQGQLSQTISNLGTAGALGYLVKGWWGALGGVAVGAMMGSITQTVSEANRDTSLLGTMRDIGVNLGHQLGLPWGTTTADEFKGAFEQRINELTVDFGNFGPMVNISDVDRKFAKIVDDVRARIEARIKESGRYAIGSQAWSDAVNRGLDRAWQRVAAHTKALRPSAKEIFGKLWDQMTPEQQQWARQWRGALISVQKLFDRYQIRVPPDIIQNAPAATKKLVDQFKQGLDLMYSGTLVSLKDINRVFKQNLDIIDKLYPQHGERWREAMAANLRAQAAAIGRQMKESGHVTEAGLKHMEQLLQRADFLDPSKKLAKDFGHTWAKGLDETHEVTKKGINTLIKDLGKLPPEARDIAAKTALNHLKEAHREGELSDKAYRKMVSAILSHYTDIETGGKKHTGKLAKSVVNIVGALVNVVSGKGGFGTLAKNINSILTDLGLANKKVHWNVESAAKAAGGFLGTLFGQTGMYVPGTGTGDKVPAMLEPGEYVVNRRAVQAIGKQRLDAINFNAAPRFAQGGIVALGKELQQMGYEVSENPAFGGVTAGAHVTNSYHYRGQAIDVNDDLPPFGFGSGEVASLTWLYNRLKGMAGIVELLWQVPDHYDHLHVAMAGKGAIGGILPQLPTLTLKGPDPFRSIGQEGLDRVRAGGQQYLEKMLPGAATGGASQGKYGPGELAQLWASTGSNGDPHLMGAIGYGESTGNPRALSSAGARGLWQIMPATWSDYGKGSFDLAYEPVPNAQTAHNVLRGQGLSAWDAYNNGSYAQYMQEGGLIQQLQEGGMLAPAMDKAHVGGRFNSIAELIRALQGKSARDMKDPTHRFIKQIHDMDISNSLRKKLDAENLAMFTDDDMIARIQQIWGAEDVTHELGGHTQPEWMQLEIDQMLDMARNLIPQAQSKVKDLVRKIEKEFEKDLKKWVREFKARIRQAEHDRVRLIQKIAPLVDKKYEDIKDMSPTQLHDLAEARLKQYPQKSIQAEKLANRVADLDKAQSNRKAILSVLTGNDKGDIKTGDGIWGVLEGEVKHLHGLGIKTKANQGKYESMSFAALLSAIWGTGPVPMPGGKGTSYGGDLGPLIAALNELMPKTQPPVPADWLKRMAGIKVGEKNIARLMELIALTETRAQEPWSPGGANLTPKEIIQQLAENKDLAFAYGHQAQSIGSLEELLKAALPGKGTLQKAWLKTTIPNLQTALESIIGLVPGGGTLGSTREHIKSLKYQLDQLLHPDLPTDPDKLLNAIMAHIELAGLTKGPEPPGGPSGYDDDIMWTGKLVSYWEHMLADLMKAVPKDWAAIGGAASSLGSARDSLASLIQSREDFLHPPGDGTDGTGSQSDLDKARADLLQQLLDEANRRNIVLTAQMPVYSQFAGAFAKGGMIPAGMWGIAGEQGPEVVHGPAGVTPLQEGGYIGRLRAPVRDTITAMLKLQRALGVTTSAATGAASALTGTAAGSPSENEGKGPGYSITDIFGPGTTMADFGFKDFGEYSVPFYILNNPTALANYLKIIGVSKQLGGIVGTGGAKLRVPVTETIRAMRKLQAALGVTEGTTGATRTLVGTAAGSPSENEGKGPGFSLTDIFGPGATMEDFGFKNFGEYSVPFSILNNPTALANYLKIIGVTKQGGGMIEPVGAHVGARPIVSGAPTNSASSRFEVHNHFPDSLGFLRGQVRTEIKAHEAETISRSRRSIGVTRGY